MLIDTSDTLDTSIYLKANLEKNMIGENYYIQNLQDKRNAEWRMRYNCVDIEEELEKQSVYMTEMPCYTPIEAVITKVKTDKGNDLGDDWAHLAFQNLKHPNKIGSRYRFALDSFDKMTTMTEEEKHYDTSVWICVNKTTIKAGNSCTVRRCNTAIPILGSPTLQKDNITEVHYEPCILENELKYIQSYYNETLPVPQAEWYITMQLNYFTNCINIDNKFMFGTIDYNNRDNNQVYKVKAVIKANSDKTFWRDEQEALEHTPLIVLALDKASLSPEDDIDNRLAGSTAIYKTTQSTPYYRPYINLEKGDDEILQGKEEDYVFNLYYNKEKIDGIKFDFKVELKGILEKNWNSYFCVSRIDDNSIKIRCNKQCTRGKLKLFATCDNPYEQGDTITEEVEIKLKGFY